MAEYSFDEAAIHAAINAAQASHNDATANSKEITFDISKGATMQAGPLLIGAQCISVTVGNHQICITLPFGIGQHCFTIPVNVPNGTVGQACLSICTTWGIPTGVRVTVVFAGVTVINQSFGKC